MAITAAELQVLLTAKDQASGVMRNVSKEASGLGKVLGGALKVGAVAGAAALVAVGAGAVASVKAAGDAAEMISKFNVVFGRYAEDSTAALSQLAQATGRSKFDLMEMASALQDTFVPLGFARGEAADLSEAMTALAVDVGSFNNVASTDVMRDFQSAIVGNHETVRKYGIVITQAALDAELLNMGIEGGVKAATEQEKVMARLNLIYAGTTDAQGDAARTSGSWANQMVSLKAVLKDTSTEIGLALLPALEPLLKDFVDLAKVAGPALTDFLTNKALPAISNMSAAVGSTLGPVMDTLGPIFQNAVATVGPIVEQIIAWFRDELPGALQQLGAFFGPTFDRLKEGFAGFGEAMAPIMPMIEDAMPYFETFAQILGGAVLLAIKGLGEAIAFLLPYIGEGIAMAVALAIEVFGGLVTFLEGAIQMIVGLFTGDMDMAREGAQKVIDGIVQIFTGLYEFLERKVANTVQMVVDLFAKMGIDLPKAVDTAVQAVVGFFTGLYDDTLEIFNTLIEDITAFFDPDTWVEIGAGMMEGVKSGIESMAQALVDAAVKAAEDAVQAVKSWLGIHSPSTVMATIGRDMIRGITVGMRSEQLALDKVANAVVDSVIMDMLEATKKIGGEVGPSMLRELRVMWKQGLAGFSFEPGETIVQGARRAFDDILKIVETRFPHMKGKFQFLWREVMGDLADEGTRTIITTAQKVEALLSAASVIGGLGGTAASMLEQRRLGPQRERIRLLEEELRLLKEQGASLAEQAVVSMLLATERKELKDTEADIAALAKQQADLSFLQQQSNLITMIRDQGLNAKDVLGGLKLGIGADLQGVIQAMTRAMQEMIKAAEDELGIASASKRFAKMGQQALQGFGLGALAGAPAAAGMVQGALGQTTNNYYTVQPTTYGSRGSMTVTDEITMLQMLRAGT